MCLSFGASHGHSELVCCCTFLYWIWSRSPSQVNIIGSCTCTELMQMRNNSGVLSTEHYIYRMWWDKQRRRGPYTSSQIATLGHRKLLRPHRWIMTDGDRVVDQRNLSANMHCHRCVVRCRERWDRARPAVRIWHRFPMSRWYQHLDHADVLC